MCVCVCEVADLLLLQVTVKLKPHPRAVPGGEDVSFPHPKKMKSSRWRRWSVGVSRWAERDL